MNDVGTVQADIEVIGRATASVCDKGDPSPYTALGVLASIRAGPRAAQGSGDLAGATVAVHGAGNVGSHLARQYLGHDDARSTARVERVGGIVADVFERADREHITTVEAATAIAHANSPQVASPARGENSRSP
ncbi:hypothetical protein AB0L53_24630 [Nonomuraea sp. NPDC052129]|uniref:hypothetical protein n=1 Tax=Nonomuraea sp. NPDC052129 TaxID=3154651 RepID=UPI0034330630